MRGVLVLAVGLCVGCGRLGIDPSRDAEDAPSPDVFELPAAPPVRGDVICKVIRHPVGPTPADVDLAITATDEGYAAVWLDTQAPGAGSAVRLGVDHQRLAVLELPYLTGTRLAGLLDVDGALVITSATGMVETVHRVSAELTTVHETTAFQDRVPSRDPLAPDAVNAGRLLVSASPEAFTLTELDDNGRLGASDEVPSGSATLQALACTNGDTHAHCAWVEDESNGETRCVAADFLFEPPRKIDVATVIDNDCAMPRTASGARDANPIVVWTTSTGSVMARYLSTQRPITTIASSGSAPKVQYDTADNDSGRFWIAWLDSAGTLWLTSFDEDHEIASYEMEGWTPRGPEAFELVRRVSSGQDEVVLAVLRDHELDLLTLCPPPM